MPFCRKRRNCRRLSGDIVFKPIGVKTCELELVEIELDEFEAIRLCDIEGKNQIEAGEIMKVSRATIQRLLESGRKKIADALLNVKAIKIKNNHEEEEVNE